MRPRWGSGSGRPSPRTPASPRCAARGCSSGLTLAQEKAPAVVAAAQDAGWIINATGPDRVRLAPPLVLGDADVEAFVAAWPGLLDAAGVEPAAGTAP